MHTERVYILNKTVPEIDGGVVVGHVYIPRNDKRRHTAFYICGNKPAAEALIDVLSCGGRIPSEGKLKEWLLRIRTVMILKDMADEFDAKSPQTILNWIAKPEHIPAGKIDKIKSLHVKLRARINKAERDSHG